MNLLLIPERILNKHMSNYADQTLKCEDCSKDFIFTAGEQEFFDKKGFSQQPKRCPDCRSARKHNKGGGGGGGRSAGGPRGDKPKFPATCSRCGVGFEAPFQPKPDRPVFCRDCFKSGAK